MRHKTPLSRTGAGEPLEHINASISQADLNVLYTDGHLSQMSLLGGMGGACTPWQRLCPPQTQRPLQMQPPLQPRWHTRCARRTPPPCLCHPCMYSARRIKLGQSLYGPCRIPGRDASASYCHSLVAQRWVDHSQGVAGHEGVRTCCESFLTVVSGALHATGSWGLCPGSPVPAG